ncbi:riboflavin biosynthesis pyrimidine reductase [Microbacterium marinum]|uniref:Riboflavin biosynthesis pyrimidine reductase n=1 Tax=Microbacterium marinum TaxID=421115 RepID=A0A7W7FIE5_9MICO|nr:riboflavin biosynthesis pyrimidine reductase [Microbacterium marinum]
MWVTEVVPSSGERVDAASASGREWLTARYRRGDSAYVRLNMITTLTGSAVGSDGTSETLTNRVDRTILGVIRSEADVVVVGAQSVRAEGYVVPRRAHLAVVSRTGDLTGHRLDVSAEAEARVLLLLPAGVTPRNVPAGASVIHLSGTRDLQPSEIVTALTERGMPRIVCEGGPDLASRFAQAGVIDEYCVTSAPVLAPASAPFLSVGADVGLAVDGMLVDDAGFSYLRLRRR